MNIGVVRSRLGYELGVGRKWTVMVDRAVIEELVVGESISANVVIYVPGFSVGREIVDVLKGEESAGAVVVEIFRRTSASCLLFYSTVSMADPRLRPRNKQTNFP